MKVSQLLSIFPELRWGDAAGLEVADICEDSRQIKKGAIFVAVKGRRSDGHRFVAQAIEQGAVALVVEDDRAVPPDYRGAVAKVVSSRSALEKLARRFYLNPAEDLFCVGVTGTNGKTTVTYMAEHILNHFGWPTGVIGTIDQHMGEHKWPSSLTTPGAMTLQRRMAEFKALGARAVAFEVSSIAIEQSRVGDLPFSVGVFTNFTRDHLDYHQTMDAYFAAKEMFFSELLGRGTTPSGSVAVLNGDDPWVRKVKVREGVTTWWFGQSAADFRFRVLKQDIEGSLFHLSTPRGNGEIQLPYLGLHNVYNAAAAVATALVAGVSLSTACDALSGFCGAPGRMEKVKNDRGLHIFVDYAHTDDALHATLSALRGVTAASHQKGRIITVFGCGGDRDSGKRPLMGAAAARLSEVIVLTSDNPRSENPGKILQEIRAGIPNPWQGELYLEEDRRQAFATALQTAREGDVILIAGKGHEGYQIIGDKTLSFLDSQEMSHLLKV